MKALKFWLMAELIYWFMRVLGMTYRIKWVGLENREKAMAHHPHGSFTLGVWHEHLFANIVVHRGMPFAPLASLSKDGDFAAYVMNRFGYESVRGSSSRGGKEARSDLVQATNRGRFVAITIDGPRGPRRVVKPGVIDISKRANIAAVPCIAIADRVWILKRSWDQFQIPKPFARVTVQYGEPMIIERTIEGPAFDEAKMLFKSRMDEAEQLARLTMNTPSKTVNSPCCQPGSSCHGD